MIGVAGAVAGSIGSVEAGDGATGWGPVVPAPPLTAVSTGVVLTLTSPVPSKKVMVRAVCRVARC
ncbi:hypothetical protein [Actinophytocola xanthii]|uniref:hypothetical protein n=1 Tax=Actinophytocola xanthii TaxID=1912961 RepID=UPI0011787B1B|nr:hypothetical protein [Actinophytocola xanthii]